MSSKVSLCTILLLKIELFCPSLKSNVGSSLIFSLHKPLGEDEVSTEGAFDPSLYITASNVLLSLLTTSWIKASLMKVDVEFVGHSFTHCFICFPIPIIKGKKHFEKIDEHDETDKRNFWLLFSAAHDHDALNENKIFVTSRQS